MSNVCDDAEGGQAGRYSDIYQCLTKPISRADRCQPWQIIRSDSRRIILVSRLSSFSQLSSETGGTLCSAMLRFIGGKPIPISREYAATPPCHPRSNGNLVDGKRQVRLELRWAGKFKPDIERLEL